MHRLLRSSFLAWISLVGAVISGVVSLGDIVGGLGIVGHYVFALQEFARALLAFFTDHTGIIVWPANIALLAFLLSIAGLAFALRTWVSRRVSSPDYDFADWLRAETWSYYRSREYAPHKSEVVVEDWRTTLPLHVLLFGIVVTSYLTVPDKLQINQGVLRMLLLVGGTLLIIRIPSYLLEMLPTYDEREVSRLEKNWRNRLSKSGVSTTDLPHRGPKMVDRMPKPVKEYFTNLFLRKFILESFRKSVWLIILCIAALGASAYVAKFGAGVEPAFASVKLALSVAATFLALPIIVTFGASLSDHLMAALLGSVVGSAVCLASEPSGSAKGRMLISLGFILGFAVVLVTFLSTTDVLSTVAKAIEAGADIFAMSPVLFIICYIASFVVLGRAVASFSPKGVSSED